MADWNEAARDWWQFTQALEEAQKKLHCSYRNAWFRGHEEAAHQLIPSALRVAPPPGLGSLANWNGGQGPNIDDLRREQPLDMDGIELNGDNLHLISEEKLNSVEGSLESDVRKMLRELRSDLYRALKGTQSAENEIIGLQNQLRPPANKQLDHNYRNVLSSRLRDLKAKQSDLRLEVSRFREQICVLRCVYYGERHSMLAFRQRSVNAASSASSWVLLAAMQHHGVPTRLLDWTTSAGVAVYFAVKKLRETMVKKEGSIANWLEENSMNINTDLFAEHKLPVIWVINPYFLARRSTGFNRIDDPSIRVDLDYLLRFHERPSWPYNGAMPAVIPWQSERIFAQRGTFTIHGRDTRPLEQQVDVHTTVNSEGSPILAKVELSLMGALYSIKHLVQFFGLDQFTMFRGEDDLALAVAEQGRKKKAEKP